MNEDQIQQLVQRGDYRQAAAAAEELGLLAQAGRLYEQLFDYRQAGRLAEAQGDLIGAVELYLKGNHTDQAEAVRRALMAELSDDIPRALELFEGRGYFLQAAELAESIGNLAQAAELYIHASSLSRAGHLFERVGRLRDAGEAYEGHLRGKPDDSAAALGLGRVLQRFGRHKEAIPLLSTATGVFETHEEAGNRIAYSFFKLGLLEAGRSALGRIGRDRNIDPETFMRPFEDELLHASPDVEAPAAADVGARGGALEGRYRLERPLRSRVGSSYLARDLLSDRAVALHFLVGSAEDNADYYQEIRRLQTPPIRGLPRILEINETAGFIATSHHEGRSLLELLESDDPPTALRSRGILVQVFEAVAGAHHRGVLHGSLSPAAITVSRGDVVTLGDWGMLHMEKRLATQTAGPDSPLAYRAPELNLGRGGDFTSDLFSVAALLHRCLTGFPPQFGQPRAQLDDWPSPFGDFFATALAVEPSMRHPSHDLFATELKSLPWTAVGARRINVVSIHDSLDEEIQGPRFLGVDDLYVGEVAVVTDTLLDREVVFLRLPMDDERPLSLINRLHALAGPECPTFQDVLLSVDEGIVLERNRGHTIEQRLAEGAVLDIDTVVEATEAVLGPLASAHAAGIGLGTVNLESVRFDGVGFRVPIAQILVVPDDHDAAAIESDYVGLWALVYVALTGREMKDPSPLGVLRYLRATGHLAPRDFDDLAQSLPTSRSLAGMSNWFADLRRAIEVHQVRRAVFDHMVDLATSDGIITNEESRYLDERRTALGLDVELQSPTSRQD